MSYVFSLQVYMDSIHDWHGAEGNRASDIVHWYTTQHTILHPTARSLPGEGDIIYN